MKKIDHQSIKDLEFPAIREIISEYCYGEKAKSVAEKLKPFDRFEQAELELLIHLDFYKIKTELSGFPRIEYDDLQPSFRFLKTQGSTLTLEHIVKIYRASLLVNDMIVFFKDRKEALSHLYSIFNEVYFTKEISEPIEKILDARFQVKDNASNPLMHIRRQMAEVRKKININFDRILRKMRSNELLGDTPEHFIRNRRVLAVQSSYKRSVLGTVVGSSKTGQLTYIEPRENEPLNYELEMLEDDERNEIARIFQVLTHELSGHYELIKSYSKLLVRLDLLNAKTRLAIQLKATLPRFEKAPKINYFQSRHPLLYLEHEKQKLPTHPQDIKLHPKRRMLVISGPNAGGKSITLKTAGLLQIMIQSGLMIPVDANSQAGWFDKIYSDIGDNQSIQNHLSTYSYRLKRMKLFLEETEESTLLLLDEFGTGSDPELGGALAEVFFEQLYRQKAFAVITTHYSNIKLKAAELEEAENASMLFDENTLKPLYKLSVGHPGSSFTFEVAQQNGIPTDLIQEARKKLKENKVNLDQLITQLQHEKVNYQEKIKNLKETEEETENIRLLYESSRNDYEEKYEKQQEFIENNNKYINYGKKLDKFIHQFTGKGKKEPVMGEIKKYLTQEKAKREEKLQKVKATEASKKPRKVEKPKKKAKKPIKVGSTVRMHGSKVNGEVIEMDETEATILMGNFKMTVSLDKIWAI